MPRQILRFGPQTGTTRQVKWPAVTMFQGRAIATAVGELVVHEDLDPESCVAPRGFVRRPRRFDGLGFLDAAWLEIEAGSECGLFVRRKPRLDEKQVRKAVRIPGASSRPLEGPALSGPRRTVHHRSSNRTTRRSSLHKIQAEASLGEADPTGSNTAISGRGGAEVVRMWATGSRRAIDPAAAHASRRTVDFRRYKARALPRLFQGFEQEEDFGGHRVV